MYVNTFICLEENVSGYGKNKKHPSGHVTITSPGVVKCYIQDLEKIAKPYMVYLVSKKMNKAIRLGNINAPEETKQTTWKIDQNNIQGSGVTAKDIDCIVVIVEGETIGNTDTVLAGYTGDKYLTTSLIEHALPKKQATKPEVKPMPMPEPKPEVKSMPKPEVKPMPKPEPKPEVKPMPKPEPKPEGKPMPKPQPEPAQPGEGPGPVIIPGEESNTSVQCECGFQVKDGMVEQEIIEKIKEIINSQQAQTASKESLERQVLSQVEKFLDKGNIEDKLNQDYKDLQVQMETVINQGVNELDRADGLAEQEEIDSFWEEQDKEKEEVEDYIEPHRYEEHTAQQEVFLNDIEKVLYNIQEKMQEEMKQKKNNPQRNRW
ncbi:MAG: hypothetical protein ACRDDX_05075 [Cellulosilyticaceae bacterium]